MLQQHAHWPIGGLTIFLVILFSQYLKKTNRAFELYPILMAIVGAWGVAALCTFFGIFEPGHPSYTSLDNFHSAPWFRVPTPFQWGMPQFGVAATVGMIAGYLASMVESIGDYYACARLSGAPVPDEKTINKGITFEGIGCFIAGIIGTGNGTTSYSENIGAIGLTRVGSRRVVQADGLIMIVLGMVSKFGALFTTIPTPIVGGMYCAMFGMIASVGMSNLQFHQPEFGSQSLHNWICLLHGTQCSRVFQSNPCRIGRILEVAVRYHQYSWENRYGCWRLHRNVFGQHYSR